MIELLYTKRRCGILFTGKKKYKIFIDSQSNFKVVLISDVKETGYYTFLKDQKKDYGLTQFLLSSKLIINLLLQFLKDKSIEVQNINLYDEDDETTKKLLQLFDDYHKGLIDENYIHQRLDYLEDDYSIDIKSVKLISNKGNYGPLTLYVNGIFENMDDHWNEVLIDNLEMVWNK